MQYCAEVHRIVGIPVDCWIPIAATSVYTSLSSIVVLRVQAIILILVHSDEQLLIIAKLAFYYERAYTGLYHLK